MHYNPELPLRLEIDTCGYAIAGILFQPYLLLFLSLEPDEKLFLPDKQPDNTEPAGKRRMASIQPEDFFFNPQAY